jgi:hypothetical protein
MANSSRGFSPAIFGHHEMNGNGPKGHCGDAGNAEETARFSDKSFRLLFFFQRFFIAIAFFSFGSKMFCDRRTESVWIERRTSSHSISISEVSTRIPSVPSPRLQLIEKRILGSFPSLTKGANAYGRLG